MKLKQLFSFFSLVVILSSCEKDEVKTIPLTSITIGNFISGGKQVKLGSNATVINNNNTNGTQLALNAGENNLYVWPVGDSLNPYYVQNKFVTADREVYSLFLGGTTANKEAILIKENIPYRTDSTAGIRFINLAANTNSKPINITLSTTNSVNEVAGLTYKNYTEFKSYPGLYNSTYTFQVRNDTSAAPKAPLATFALTSSAVPRFANITLVIRQNGTNGLAVTRVNQDR